MPFHISIPASSWLKPKKASKSKDQPRIRNLIPSVSYGVAALLFILFFSFCRIFVDFCQGWKKNTSPYPPGIVITSSWVETCRNKYHFFSVLFSVLRTFFQKSGSEMFYFYRGIFLSANTALCPKTLLLYPFLVKYL